MSSRPEDDSSSPASTRQGGFANVFRTLTSSKSADRSLQFLSPPAAPPRTDLVNASSSSSSQELSSNHMDALGILRTGNPNERIAAAGTLKYAIPEYPVKPVLDIWYAAKDMIELSNSTPMRIAGWELLTECAKHPFSTDLERKEYFQTISAPANPKDFHLQLAALVDLTNHGRAVSGFDYDLVPLLTSWLRTAYMAARKARRYAQSHRGQRSSTRGRTAASGEEKNMALLFQLLHDVIKFSSNNANEASVSDLIDSLLAICMKTSVEIDLEACIDMLDAVVTFGSIPRSQLSNCVRVLSSIYSMVPELEKNAWNTIANLCKSHNGQAVIRIILDVLRNSPTDGGKNDDLSREVKGALAVLQKLLSKSTEKGYPTVPYAPLVDGLSNAIRATPSPRVYSSVLSLINLFFHEAEGRVHRLIADEDWSACLEVAAECGKRANSEAEWRRDSVGHEELPKAAVDRQLVSLIRRLDAIVNQKPGEYVEFVPREAIIGFFTDVHPLLPDATARTVLDYFQELRCCSPSDLNWEENLSLVLDAFFSNRQRSPDIRLRALQTTMDAYEIVDLVGDGAEQSLIPRLARSILQNAAKETDIRVLDAIIALMVSIVASCDLDLFDYVIDTLKGIIISDRLRSPISSPPSSATASTSIASHASEGSPSNAVTKGYVKMFLQVVNNHGEKSVRLFNALVSIAKNGHCEVDARLTAMKFLFRLRADWADRVFVTDDADSGFLATTLCRTEAAMAKRQAEEVSQSFRSSKGDFGGQKRPSRGVSFSQGSSNERGVPVRTLSGTKSGQQNTRQLWSCSDTEALPGAIPALISPVLVAHTIREMEAVEDGPGAAGTGASVLDMAAWLNAVLAVLQGSDWEVYSFALVHLPSQLSNHAIFRGCIAQIQELHRMICEQIRTNGFQEPPIASGLRRADVAICLFHSLTMILSYHEHFSKSEEDEIVKIFVLGIAAWERTAKYCIHALSICCHELPLSTSRSLMQMLNQMAAIITQPHVSIHILEFLASLSRLREVFINFREDDFRTVFGICFRYLEFAREKRQSNRSSHASEAAGASTPGSNSAEPTVSSTSDDVPQYVHALAYHVVLFWFLALKLQDRANHVGWIVKKLFPDGDGSGHTADDQALTSIDFMQRVTYADAAESAEDPQFNEDRLGTIVKKQWLLGNSIVTVKQATTSGLAEIVKRQPSGTSAYTVRETFTPPPPHQAEAHVDVSREGQETSNAVLPSHLLVQLLSPVPQTFESARPIPLPDDEATERAIRVFDRSSSLDGHKVGVIYIGEGQTGEAEILANVSGSRDYLDFLNNLGTLTRLKGAKFNTQGLDREYDTDGHYTYCWRDRVTEIVFHVTTQMPTDLERDPNCTLKKRHIGNDFVNIIFNDSGLPFRFDTFPSQFNFVNIVLTPASRASFVASRSHDPAHRQPFYRVQVMSRPGFPEVSPASQTKMISLRALPGFIRLLALNASMFSVVWHNREGGEFLSSWSARLREIKRLREKHGPRTAAARISSPPTSTWLGATAAAATTTTSTTSTQVGGQQTEGSRPSSSVRDSLGSLRRTSVATFFTSTSEQTSHRSSLLSTSATSHDTELAPATGMSSLVDSIDFSKWA